MLVSLTLFVPLPYAKFCFCFFSPLSLLLALSLLSSLLLLLLLGALLVLARADGAVWMGLRSASS
jgi:hypothetical protein